MARTLTIVEPIGPMLQIISKLCDTYTIPHFIVLVAMFSTVLAISVGKKKSQLIQKMEISQQK